MHSWSLFNTLQPKARPLLDDQDRTLQSNVNKHEVSFRTAHTSINDDNVDTRAWAKLLNRKCDSDENDGIYLKMEQMDTPKMVNGKLQVDNVVPSYIEIELIVTAQGAPTESSRSPKKSQSLE